MTHQVAPREPPATPVAGPLRLAVAAHCVFTGRIGGAEHMLYNLLRGLWSHDIALDILCARTQNLDPGFLAEAAVPANVRVLASGRTGPRFLTEQLSCLEGGHAADAVLFPNYFVPPIVPRRLGAVLCVLHDMQYRHLRTNFSGRKRLWLRLAHNLAVRRCDRLVVISEFVREDAIRHLGDAFAERIVVVPNAISWERFAPLPTRRTHTGRPTILSLAAQYEHKNLPTLVRAFAALAPRFPDARLVLCGQDYAGLRGVAGQPCDLRALAAGLGVGERVVFTGYLDDTALARHFHAASVFAFPSVFEGFGMPPVEALGLGLPTLTTRRTALPEVTRGLANYVDDPHDVGEWAERLAAMLQDPDGHAPTLDAAAALRARYAPARIAAEYIAACRAAIAG